MSANGHAPHILVLNSSADFLQLMHDLLTDEGYRVTIEDTVHATTNAIAQLQPDLVILDFLWIDDDSGWKLLQLLRLDPRTKDIPLILCTAGAQEAEALRPQRDALNVGVVLKSFNLDMLLEAVRRQLPPAS